MEKFRFDIDTKSLFYGVKNDTGGGHTATVSTNLKQGPTTKQELSYILELNNEISIFNNDNLIFSCLKNSKSTAKLLKVLYFKNIYVNGIKINNEFEFGMYIKEEINPNAIQYGRIKLHYPIGFKYEDCNHEINNKHVLDLISKIFDGYSFIVNSFTFYIDNPRLDLDVSILGENDVPYSKVFVDQKGAGNKFNRLFSEESDSYDYEILALKRSFPDREINSENYFVLKESEEQRAIDLVLKLCSEKGYVNVNPLIRKYPYSPVDVEYYKNNEKYYVIIKYTSTSMNSFFLSKHEYGLLANPNLNVSVILVKNASSTKPSMERFDYKKVSAMDKEIISLRIHD